MKMLNMTTMSEPAPSSLFHQASLLVGAPAQVDDKGGLSALCMLQQDLLEE